MEQLSYLKKLYYIMDGSGNFYRLSASGQLVAAPGKEEAETFTYMAANQKIGYGKKAKFYRTIEVEEIEKMEQPNTDHSEEKTMAPATPVVSTISEPAGNESEEDCAEEIKMEQIEEKADPFDISQINWKEYLENFCSIMEALKEYRVDLEIRQLEFEQRLQDLLHYAELCDMDDNRRLEIMDMIVEARQCRRDVKDEIQRIEYFQQALGSNSVVGRCKNSIRQMEKLMSRIYHPRRDRALFQGAEFHVGHELPFWNKKQMSLATEEVDSDDYEEDYDHNAYGSGEEEQMEQERVDTVFDGKKNNWLDFARQQKEFYDNVWQHMTNLEIDIRTIDARIEEVLVKIEDSNFNVTQGYKVFKELKDLRNEKKDKLKELDELRSLTEGIDCRYMSETLTYSVQEIEQINGNVKQEIATVSEEKEVEMETGPEMLVG